jgi:succinate dehydrogenase / fumarate reductase cytochrome b subunit
MTQKCCDTAKFTSSVAKQLLVAVTGLVLVVFILGHLAGNLLIYAGMETFNGYAERLASLGELLWVMRAGLLTAFVLHIATALHLNLSNRSTREQAYAVVAYRADKTVATRLMLYSGIFILAFFFFHIYDFTLADKAGPRSFVDGATTDSLGLYGIVWNAFSNPLHSLFYIVGVAAVGLHLTHSVSSIWVTLGMLTHRATTYADTGAKLVGAAVFLGFASIPVYVFLRNLVGGPL